jgi:putative transcriptional regulator
MGSSTIRNTIRRLRFESGEMTQQHLAEQAGVTRQTIVAIEGGKYAPSLELAFKIASVFGKPLEEVFQYEDGNPPSQRVDGREDLAKRREASR